MAHVNGHVGTQEKKISPTPYLGKRKRADSQEPGSDSISNSIPVETLENAMQLIRRHEASEKVLQYPLPARNGTHHTSKRQRTGTLDMEGEKMESENIECRARAGCYHSVDDLLEDLAIIRAAVTENDPTADGDTDSYGVTEEQVQGIWENLVKYQARVDASQSSLIDKNEHEPSNHPPILPKNQVLTLRSQTEHGIRQLFSGLSSNSDMSDAEGRKLPNGFELAEATRMDRVKSPEREGRKFGDVFAPHRTVKTLEMPKTSRTSRGHTLEFVPPFENLSPSNRNDYRYTNLSTGSWLKYATMDRSTLDIRKRPKDGMSRANALFKSTFSSFAPTSDNATAAVPASDRSRQWWRKYCKPTLDLSIWDSQTEKIEPAQTEIDEVDFEKDMDMLIANYIPEDDISLESDKVLDEISELIETLTSYQAMRDLETARGPASASKPSKEEFSTYELLKAQFQLLVSSLPPFAVAKLNGDQLEDLNISTHLLITPSEFSGTAQMDDHTLRRNRAAQAAVSAASRSAGPTPNRPTYGTPATAYNAQARAYNASMPGSAYAGRPAAPVYNTIRPGTGGQSTPYVQNNYRPTGATIHTPSIQQFQRPMTNGYGSNSITTPQPSYMQRPSQPGYQQKAQEAGHHNRSDSPPKSMVNGQSQQYQQRQHTSMNSNYTNAVHNAASQRQTSGTPQPPADAPEKAVNTSRPVRVTSDTVV